MIIGGFFLQVAVAVFVAAGAGDGSPVQAQHTPHKAHERYVDPAAGLTLAELIARGLREEPGLQAARLDVTAATHAARQAGLRANPALTIERRQEVGGRDRQFTAMVEWPVELLRRGARVSTARAEVEAVTASAADRERLLALEIRMQYGRLLVAVHHVGVFTGLSAASRETLSLLDARAREGAAPRLDRDAAAVDAGRIEARLALASGAAEAALLELKRLVGLPPSTALKVRETLEQAVTVETVVTRLGKGAEPDARPDVREAAANVRVQAARTEQLRREGRLDLSLIGGYMRMDAGFPQQAFGAAGRLEPIRGVFHNAQFGAMVTVPLFDRNQGATAEADTRRAAAERALEASRLAAATEIAAAESRVRAAREALAVFAGPLLETGRRNLDVIREAYQLGRNTLLDVLAEQRRYLDLEMAHSDALAEAFDAQAALWGALGGEQR
jgi:cobalt-zinc-cadmium efflux system outer membrane protein